MTPARLLECLAVLAWSKSGLAKQLGRPEATVRQWERGLVRIPEDVAEWLEIRAEHAAKYPPPVRPARDPENAT